ncbi:MAG: NAD(P)/FAD-dependent oxidoreductase [Beijerinckiaceae bacterium]|nr:NAD(P)/FAD-dependent oxidoreductase [Beijerinckiaceae bacterium]
MLDSPNKLDALSAQIRSDLDRIAHPRQPWLEPKTGPDGKPVFDVAVVGAGQSGIATAFGLMRAQVRNILVIDKAERGMEGPWRTYARMKTLRSPKDFTGPDLDLPSLTYQSWHEARFGAESWAALDLIPKELWAEYLLFVRDVVGVPVENGTALRRIAPAGDCLRLDLIMSDGETRTIYARKIVLATGQEGAGLWWMPEFIRALPPHLRAHAADDIAFERLKGTTVAVLGAGASAFDNAATALEAGASEVHLFCRRATPQTIQPYRWLTFAGFLRHFSELDDAWRWRFMSQILGLREGFPQETYDRCRRHANFILHEGEAWTGASETGGRARLTTTKGSFEADFLICGTGVEMDFSARAEFDGFAGNIATWADRYEPPAEERDERLARFPYLGPDFAFCEKVSGLTPFLRDIHLFAIGSTMSHGPSGSSINAMTTAVPKLVSGVTRGLFEADLDRHWRSLQRYDVPQAILR